MKRCVNCGCMINVGTPCHNCGYLSLADTFTCQRCGIQTDRIYTVIIDHKKEDLCKECLNREDI